MSSSDIAVSVRGVSKAYTISHNEERHVTLAETVLARVKNPFKRAQRETFWALNDVSFDIQKGDVVGIIGRNGAGKSTLLKILSRITQPTKGEIEVRGRIGSLLEVGTGFHPELTGRENVYLNGQILGMRKKEIDRQFDAIVEFSGVEQFLDTPVKRYSSGMYVRLAFAVAAHLPSEILVVDEVLAVGDVEFQKKCLGKMRDVSSDGRTVLFVSHNLGTVQSLCGSGILLQKGKVLVDGDVNLVLTEYRQHGWDDIRKTPIGRRSNRSGTGAIRLTGFRMENHSGQTVSRVLSGDHITFAIEYSGGIAPSSRVDIGVSFSTEDERLLSVLYSSFTGVYFGQVAERGEFCCSIGRFPLAAGSYLVGARVTVNGEEADWPRDPIATIEVDPGDFFGTGSIGFTHSAPILLDGNWTNRCKDISSERCKTDESVAV